MKTPQVRHTEAMICFFHISVNIRKEDSRLENLQVLLISLK